MRKVNAIAIALAIMALPAIACGETRYSAEVGPVVTAAPPPTAPAPVVIVMPAPAPASAGVSPEVFVIALALIAVVGVMGGAAAAIAAMGANGRKREPMSTPERSQLNEAPTYLPPAPEPGIYIVFPPGYDELEKIDYIASRYKITRAEARAVLSNPAPRQLPGGR